MKDMSVDEWFVELDGMECVEAQCKSLLDKHSGAEIECVPSKAINIYRERFVGIRKLTWINQQ